MTKNPQTEKLLSSYSCKLVHPETSLPRLAKAAIYNLEKVAAVKAA